MCVNVCACVVDVLPLGVVVQAKDDLHGDDDEGGSLDVVPRQEGPRLGVTCVERLVCHTSALHQPADPGVELVWGGGRLSVVLY